MNAREECQAVIVRDTGVWGTVENWARVLNLPEVLLRERLESCPSRLTWVHEEEFDYVTDAYCAEDVRRACADLLAESLAA